jgi:hypothetical protein
VALFIQSALLAKAGVPHGFSLRDGGISSGPFASLNLGASVGDHPEAVKENTRRLAEAAGFSPDAFVTVAQVHGDRVVEAPGEVELTNGRRTEADAVVTARPGLAPAVRTADCVPLLLWAPDAGAVAAVHVGWRGAKARVAARAVEALAARYRASPAQILAAVGPSIRACCYEVSADLAAEFTREFGALAVAGNHARPHLDLVHVVRATLAAVGVAEDRVDVVGACTSDDRKRFFSHRRDHGNTGRHLAFIARPG